MDTINPPMPYAARAVAIEPAALVEPPEPPPPVWRTCTITWDSQPAPVRFNVYHSADLRQWQRLTNTATNRVTFPFQTGAHFYLITATNAGRELPPAPR